MPVITLIDGSQYHFKHPVSSLEIIQNIKQELAKDCIASFINGELTDAVDLIEHDAQFIAVTTKDEIAINIIRQSCAYLLGYTIKQLWPEAKMALSSTNDTGFYYDIDINNSLTQEDLKQIEKRMHELIETNKDIIKQRVKWHQAHTIFVKLNENYKIYLLDKDIDHDRYINLYYYNGYVDMCNGPIVYNTRFCYYFSLQKISGAYWLGDNKNKMLQRIYGTAWNSKNTLNKYLHNLKEIIKRDHRKINKQLDLYHMQEEAPGMIFWHNNGWIIFRELESFIRLKLNEFNYKEVKSPLMMDRFIWERTGHWDNYAEHMFSTFSEYREYCIKPMNCPGHVQIFNQGLRSYRDLPIRIAEFGNCHRNEPSGSLHGLMRVRCFTQDDGHIFCTENQVCEEINNCIKMLYAVYNTFGFKDIKVKLSTRPAKRIGNDNVWNLAEQSLITVLMKNNICFEYQAGAGSFYGPKIEFTLLDSLHRAWQCGTIQLDFSLPERLKAFYIGANNERIVPVMIHRAILGSLERFIGILTEEYIGFYPTWLAPTQVVVMNINMNQSNYVIELIEKLLEAGIRVKADLRNETIGAKIREHTLHRIPYMFICGDNEMATGKVAVRTQRGKKLGNIDIKKIILKLQNEINNRNLYQAEE